jgi:choline dehydrogenase-like flavoprotein
MIIYPAQSDFNAWESLGNPKWGWESMESYFRKFHTFTEPQEKLKKELQLNYLNAAAHGTDGPIQISYGSEEGFPPFAQAWPRTWAALCKPIDGDPIQGKSIGAFSNAASLHPVTRERSHAGNSYFSEEVAKRPNLRVVTEAYVEKVLLTQQTGPNGLKATGVTFAGKDGQKRVVTAKKEVIMAAGAVKTPQLLELSGIGSKDVLSKQGIECLLDNPNVGENLQDHGFVPFSWEVADPMTSGDQMRNPSVVEAVMAAYMAAKAGPLSVNSLASAFFPLQDENAARIDVSKLISDLGYADAEPKVLRDTICAEDNCLAQFTLAPFQLNPFPGEAPSHIYGMGTDGYYASIVAVLNHPFSRGSVHIKSADPSAAPTLDPRTMTHPLDLELHARHVLLLEKLRDTAPMKELFKEDGRRLHNNNKRVETLEEAKEAVKNGYTTHYHLCGTAAMMPRESGGVVDANLKVYGVDGLRIVDASIFPQIPRGNIQASVYAVAERAADILSS